MTDELSVLLKDEPAYRLKQVHEAWFNPKFNSYGDITSLAKSLREKLKSLPWFCLKLERLATSEKDGTQKALLKLADGKLIETVLMSRVNKKANSDEARYTVCLSTQVGCGMNCAFCATGKQGFDRNLTAQEIVDQYRFWRDRLGNGNEPQNIVLMGQGEPLLNFENVKEALKIFIDCAKVGPRKITVSTCGVKPAMEKILTDDFPPVRLALSLHSAIDETRAKLIPSHQKDFFDFLKNWAPRYHQKFSSRAHFLGIEYIMLGGINDDTRHLKALIRLASALGRIRINLLPYNAGAGAIFHPSEQATTDHWRDALMKAGFTITVRLSQGGDISAACGQLRAEALK